MEKTMSPMRKALAVFLSVLLCLGGYLSLSHPQEAFAVDVGANPHPKVDIAVNVPADYPGTFLDFKQELTQKLIAEGMKAEDFRITDTAAKIDTTNLDGWYVYDHYYDETEYNKIVPATVNGQRNPQLDKQPFRQADNSHTTPANGSAVTMESLLKNGNISGCRNFSQHIWSYSEDGKSNMVFAGYGTKPFLDYMIYPATSDSRRTVSFDVDANAIGNHTLWNYGFLVNAGIDNGKLVGYMVYVNVAHNGNVQKINLDVNANAVAGNYGALVTTPAAPGDKTTFSMGLTATKKARMTVELQKNKVTIQTQQYDTKGNLGDPVTAASVALQDTGYNGFGPFVGYQSHGCNELTVMRFLDLEMAYEATAFDALKTTQFYEGADQKYFINLVNPNSSSSNRAMIPETVDESYADGINRMNENEIFYISNANDGKILQDDPTSVTHQNLKDNGLYALDPEYVTQMAKYIYKNFSEGIKFSQSPIESDLPLANFYIKDATPGSSNEGNQLMTVHLKHLVNEGAGAQVRASIVDKSRPNKDNVPITHYEYKITDPKGNEILSKTGSTFNEIASAANDLVFTKDGVTVAGRTVPLSDAAGKYIFTLQITDNQGHISKASQTYLVAFDDDKAPNIEGRNSSKNIATITLTDTGQGIDADGITFMDDDRGSGVAAYYVTNNKDLTKQYIENMPAENWITLDEVQHQVSFEYEITDTEPIVVWVKDECGNIGNKAVFEPTHVVVQDADGNPLDDYYVIGDKPIIVLPEDEEVPPSEDPDDKFSGWKVGDKDITPGTNPDVPADKTIVIRPSYSKDYAKIYYLPGASDAVIEGANQVDKSMYYEVVNNSSLYAKVTEHNVKATRKGYKFAGWKLMKYADSDTNQQLATNAANLSYITNPTNLVEVGENLATVKYGSQKTDANGPVFELDTQGNPKLDKDGNKIPVYEVVRDTYYLVAQWEAGDYAVRLDPNGGTVGKIRGFENIKYGAEITGLSYPTEGRDIPSRSGYDFRGWSTVKYDPAVTLYADVKASGHMISAVNTAGVTLCPSYKMPDNDMTVYAVWEQDTSKMLVRFDSNGGNAIADHAYAKADTTYRAASTPTKPGYDFVNWVKKSDNTTVYPAGQALPSSSSRPQVEEYVAQWTESKNTRYQIDYYLNTGVEGDDGKDIYMRAGMTDESLLPYSCLDENGKVRPELQSLYDVMVADLKKPYSEVKDKLGGKTAVEYYQAALDSRADVQTIKKYYTAPTESTADIPDQNRIKELVHDGVTYYLDNEDTRNARGYVGTAEEPGTRGKVTGTPTLALRLYYKRYVTLTPVVATDDGTGTALPGTGNPSETEGGWITPRRDDAEAQKIAQGESRTVRWGANPGYGVARIYVDGYCRDDLLGKGQVTFDNLAVDHEVYVLFKKGAETPTPLPEENSHYDITAEITGCYDGTCTITPGSKRVRTDESATVTWNIAPGYEIVDVKVDDVSFKYSSKPTITFDKVRSNHHVAVEVRQTDGALPTIGGSTTDGQYTVTVNRYGGDGKCTVSKSVVTDKGKSVPVSWSTKESSDYMVYTVKLNGVDQDKWVKDSQGNYYDEREVTVRATGNMVVDIYFSEKAKDSDPDKPEPVIPDYRDPANEEHYVKVTTQLEGVAGEITNGAVLKQGSDYEVSWNIPRDSDPNSPNYVYYDIESVTINGQEATLADGSTTGSIDPSELKNLTEDSHVVVKAKPVAYSVNVVKYGNGTVDTSKLLFKGQNKTGIFAKAAMEGSKPISKIRKIVIDGKVEYEEPETETVEAQSENAAEAKALSSDAAVKQDSAGSDGESSPEAPSGQGNGAASPSTSGEEGSADKQDSSVPGKGDVSESAGSADSTPAEPSLPDQATNDPSEDSCADAQGESIDPVEGLLNAVMNPATAYAADEVFSDTFGFQQGAKQDTTEATFAVGGIAGDHTVIVFFSDIVEPKDDTPEEQAKAKEEQKKKDEEVDKVVEDITNPDNPNRQYFLVTGTVVEVDDDGNPIKDAAGNYVTIPGNVTGQIVKKGYKQNLDGSGLVEEKSKVTMGYSVHSSAGKNHTLVGAIDNNGNALNVVGSKVQLDEVIDDTTVYFMLRKTLPGDRETPQPPSFHPDQAQRYKIETEIIGGAGSISAPTTLVAGSNYRVVWDTRPVDKAKDGTNTENVAGVAQVKIDGKVLKRVYDLDTHYAKYLDSLGNVVCEGAPAMHGEYTFYNLQADHAVQIIIGERTPDLNLDLDGDDRPDINIDTDGDGLPDINVDVDGDRVPDINIDTNNTGQWKTSSEYADDLAAMPEGPEKEAFEKNILTTKPDTNIDFGNGRGPIDTDFSDPIDEDNDGIDDRWVPDSEPKFGPDHDGGVAYDTVTVPTTDTPVVTEEDGYTEEYPVAAGEVITKEDARKSAEAAIAAKYPDERPIPEGSTVVVTLFKGDQEVESIDRSAASDDYWARVVYTDARGNTYSVVVHYRIVAPNDDNQDPGGNGGSKDPSTRPAGDSGDKTTSAGKGSSTGKKSDGNAWKTSLDFRTKLAQTSDELQQVSVSLALVAMAALALCLLAGMQMRGCRSASANARHARKGGPQRRKR